MCIVTCQPQTDIGRLLLSLGTSAFPLIRLLIYTNRLLHRRSPNRVVPALDSKVQTQEFWQQRDTCFRAVSSSFWKKRQPMLDVAPVVYKIGK